RASKDVRSRIAPQILQPPPRRAAGNGGGVYGADGGAYHEVGLKAAFFKSLPHPGLVSAECAASGKDQGPHRNQEVAHASACRAPTRRDAWGCWRPSVSPSTVRRDESRRAEACATTACPTWNPATASV